MLNTVVTNNLENNGLSIQAKGIPKEGSQAQELRKRYKSLFNQLEREYFYLILEEGSDFYNPQDERVKRYRQNFEEAKKHQ